MFVVEEINLSASLRHVVGIHLLPDIGRAADVELRKGLGREVDLPRIEVRHLLILCVPLHGMARQAVLVVDKLDRTTLRGLVCILTWTSASRADLSWLSDMVNRSHVAIFNLRWESHLLWGIRLPRGINSDLRAVVRLIVITDCLSIRVFVPVESHSNIARIGVAMQRRLHRERIMFHWCQLWHPHSAIARTHSQRPGFAGNAPRPQGDELSQTICSTKSFLRVWINPACCNVSRNGKGLLSKSKHLLPELHQLIPSGHIRSQIKRPRHQRILASDVSH